MQHTGFGDDLVAFRLVDITGERGDQKRRKNGEDNEHDDELDKRKAAAFFEFLHKNSFLVGILPYYNGILYRKQGKIRKSKIIFTKNQRPRGAIFLLR